MARRAGAVFRNGRFLWAVVLITSSAATWPSFAVAGPEDDAEVYVKKGIALRKQGKDFQALEQFQRAHDIVQTPRTTGQLGLVEFALSRWEAAEEHMEAALQASGDAWIVKNRAVLERSLKTITSHIGQIELRGQPAGATVIVNGRERGALPLAGPIRVGEGFAEVELQMKGYRSERRTLTVRGEFTEQLFMKLDPLTTAVTPVVTAPVAPPAPSKDADAEVAARAEGPDKPFPTMTVLSYTLAGVGVAALGAGVAFSLKVRSIEKDIASDTQSSAGVEAEALGEKMKSGRRYQTLQWVGYGVGLAAIAGGVTCWFLDRRKGSDESGLAILPTATVAGAGAAVAGTF